MRTQSSPSPSFINNTSRSDPSHTTTPPAVHMGSYDRDAQWRMMQQNNSYNYTPYSTSAPTDASRRTRTPEYSYMMIKGDASPGPPLPPVYGDYEHVPTPPEDTSRVSEWGYSTAPRYLPPTSSYLPPPARTEVSLSSPTVVFGGMEPLMNDYGAHFYPLWNGGQGTAYDEEAEGKRGKEDVTLGFAAMAPFPSGSVAASMDPPINVDEELKMEYPPLNQGDLDYIYGSIPSPAGPAILGDAQAQRLTYSDRFKREALIEENKSTSSGMPLTGLPPSGFRSLARSADSLELKQRAQLQASYHAQKATNDASLLGASASNAGASSGSSGGSAKRPRSRQCDFPGCDNRARSHQKCKKHGGAHVCVFEGCTKNSQSRGLCIAHGGGSRCKIDGCTRASQSKGLCKSHGGGEFCAVQDCRKKAHLKHLCRNHGGGVRCKHPKCIKWAQRKGWCMVHAKEVFGS